MAFRKPVAVDNLQVLQGASSGLRNSCRNTRRCNKALGASSKKMLPSGMPEAEAIERAQQGDGQCFESLYSMHKRRVYSLCLRMTGNTAEAEDLTQEAFLQLYRKIATFRGESAFSTWLHRLAVNVVLMHLRKKGLPEVSLEESMEPNRRTAREKDMGTRIKCWPARLTASIWNARWRVFRRDTASFLCCMM